MRLTSGLDALLQEKQLVMGAVQQVQQKIVRILLLSLWPTRFARCALPQLLSQCEFPATW